MYVNYIIIFINKFILNQSLILIVRPVSRIWIMFSNFCKIFKIQNIIELYLERNKNNGLLTQELAKMLSLLQIRSNGGNCSELARSMLKQRI